MFRIGEDQQMLPLISQKRAVHPIYPFLGTGGILKLGKVPGIPAKGGNFMNDNGAMPSLFSS